MKKASEYMEHARECRQLAQSAASPAHRDMLLNMAATWESLAKDREERIAREARIKDLDVKRPNATNSDDNGP